MYSYLFQSSASLTENKFLLFHTVLHETWIQMRPMLIDDEGMEYINHNKTEMLERIVT